MAVTFSNTIILIPIDRIHVLNPRDRGRQKFHQIATNINAIGLKKPVTVALASSETDNPQYHLVCGQGRLEAYKFLEQSEIPCIVVQGTKEELLLMSLTENLARRQHSCLDMMKQLGLLKEQGYANPEIAKKIGMDASYVRGLLKLLDKAKNDCFKRRERNSPNKYCGNYCIV